MQALYFALSFLGNMAMLTAAYFIARQRPISELNPEKVAQIEIGAAFIFVSASSFLAWICSYAYYSVFGHPWEVFQNSKLLRHFDGRKSQFRLNRHFLFHI